MLVFFSHTLFLQVITFVLRPTVTYRALELDVPSQWLGVIAASFAVVPLLLAVPIGIAVDRYGERRTILAGSMLIALAAVLFAWSSSTVVMLVIGSVILGTGHICCVVGQQSTVANRTATARYDSAFGRFTFIVSIGQAIGPALILLIGGDGSVPDTSVIFWWAAGMSGLLLLISSFLERVSQSPVVGGVGVGSIGQLIRLPGLLSALTVSCVVLAAIDITLVYLPALGAERDISAGLIGVLLAIRALASMASRLFLGPLAVLIARRRLLVTSTLMSSIGLAAIAVPMPVWAIAVVMVFVGFGLGIGQPLTMSWLAESTPHGLRGRAMSLRLSGNRLGQVVVPSAAGFLAIGAGAAGVLVVTAVGLAAVSAAAGGMESRRPPLEPG